MADQTPRANAGLLRRMYLAQGEDVRAATRATKLYFFPAPSLTLAIMGVLDYALAASRLPGLPEIPGATAGFSAIAPGSDPVGAEFVLYLATVLTVGAVLFLGIRYLRWVRTVYAVTSSRVLVQRGVFARDLAEIPISQVRGVEVRQTVLHRLFGFGTLRVSSEQNSRLGNEDWVGIPGPFEFQRIIANESQRVPLAPTGPGTPPPRPG